MLRYLEIKNQLQELIAALSPGERLPDRITLCKKFDTTRTTLDKAIGELTKQGLLTSRKGSGTYVAGTLEGSVPDSENWCVIVPNIVDPIYGGLVKGIESVAQLHNANLILCNSDNDSTKQEKYIRRLLISGVAGFIIVPIITDDPAENYRLYSNLICSNVPFIFCNRSVEGVSAPIVTSNDFYGGYIATKHLIDNGYRKITYIARHKYRTSMDRCQGYMTALLENKIDINRRLIIFPSPELQASDDYLQELTDLLISGETDAVFCFNDSIALQVSNIIKSVGLTISDDIGIIGYDNTDGGKSHSPSLSSVSYKIEEIGKKAAHVLCSLCSTQNAPLRFEYYLFQPEVIPRDSCKGKRAPMPQ